jgi:hypothetical protein
VRARPFHTDRTGLRCVARADGTEVGCDGGAVRLTSLVRALFCLTGIALALAVWHESRSADGWATARPVTVALTGTTSQGKIMSAGMAGGRPAEFRLQV